MTRAAPLLGCIADDFTGATDLANMLTRGGMRTVQTIGVPQADLPEPVDAIVVALKSRTIPAADAVALSLDALRWLRAQGCERFYFKYCSTFDSTDAGNIGPVAEALMAALGCDLSLACPAFPDGGRTVFRGHLFVGDLLLSESGMRDHPLTPMRDPDLVRVLGRQCSGTVGLLRYDVVARGVDATRVALGELASNGARLAIADALSDDDLVVLGRATLDIPLLTGGSGLGLGIAVALREAGRLAMAADAAALPVVGGRAAVLAGSCSPATQAQVAHWCASRPAFRIDPLRLAAGEPVVAEAIAFAREKLAEGPVLLYATAAPEAVREAQAALGAGEAGDLVERAMAEAARGLRAAGVRRLVVAGGETSGAVVQALGVTALRIGAQIDPGVPWTVTIGAEPMALALKSGNFGGADFFAKALRQLEA